ncbi:MAG: hypothetical protein RLZZ618_4249 [Pseudomonadota bacterium]|jgi:PAS domain S-box-containing protein
MNVSRSDGSLLPIRRMVDHVPAMLAYWDRNLQCRFANFAYERWFGVDPDSLVGTSIKDLLGPELFALDEPYIRGALGGTEQQFERVVPGPDGVRRQSLATYVPDMVNGQVVGFIAHVADVTKLKVAEAALRMEAVQREAALEQLRRSEATLVEAQRLGGVGNWEWDMPTDTMVWSAQMQRMFGRAPSGSLPAFADQAMLYPKASWERLQAAISETVSLGAPHVVELEYIRADGELGWLEAHGEVVRGEAGAVTQLRGTVQDITWRHHVEEGRLKVATAEAASRNKTQMLSRVSHELRTPLNAIMGFAQLLTLDDALDPKHRRWASTIAGAGQHMLELVDELLDFASAEAGRIGMQRTETDVAAMLQESISQATAAAGVKGIAFSGLPAGQAVVLFRGDRKRLKQVVDNLLSNAIKYTATGGEVAVALTETGNEINIAVRDTGLGLSPEQLEKIFTPFERLGAEMSGVPGTGLGLSLSKALVELMGGHLRVESRPGVGSTFTVALGRTLRSDEVAQEPGP